MKRITAKGFTLVELLIVIALLGVIATIVIAAINPIEQANRSRDAGMKADASQIVSALQRYYTGQNKYPFTTDTGSADDALTWTNANDPTIGLVNDTEGNPGALISTNELQVAFLSRSFITASSNADSIFIGKGAGASSSVFVCWVPKSNSARQTAITNGKVMTLASDISATTGLPEAGACTAISDTAWNPGENMPTCAECVPE